jgi:hypothetical protein
MNRAGQIEVLELTADALREVRHWRKRYPVDLQTNAWGVSAALDKKLAELLGDDDE